jgi:Ca2+-binding RTX toxin-like protein
MAATAAIACGTSTAKPVLRLISPHVGTGGHAQGDTVTSIDWLPGSNFNDILRGTSVQDTLYGQDGDDILEGRSGDDLLSGGEGADRLDGGPGADTAEFQMSQAAIVIDLVAGTGSGGNAHGDVLISIERIIGSDFSDLFISNADANTFNGGAGNGDDTVSYASSTAAVSINLAASVFSGGSATGDKLFGISCITGSENADTLVGSSGTNTLNGGGGPDTITGGGGADRLIGGGGADRFIYAATSDSSSTSLDMILGFERGTDVIDLSGVDAIAGAGDDAFTFIGLANFSGVAGQLRYSLGSVAAGSFALVEGDTDGDGVAELVIRVEGVSLDLKVNEFIA